MCAIDIFHVIIYVTIYEHLDYVETFMANKILIVEDDDLLRPMYTLVLEKSGFEVDSVNTGTAALEYLKQTDAPAVAILDVNLPGRVSGLKVAQFIRKTEHLASTRIIILTGNPHAIRADESDIADIILIKPVNIHELTTLTGRLIPKTLQPKIDSQSLI